MNEIRKYILETFVRFVIKMPVTENSVVLNIFDVITKSFPLIITQESLRNYFEI